MTQPSDQVKAQSEIGADEKPQNRRELRQFLKQQRTAISVEDKRQWDQTIARHLRSLVFDLKPETLAVFWPIQSEPDLLACFYELHQSGLRLALPIVLAKAQPLQFVAWQPGQAMEKDAYGIAMPVDRSREVVPDCIVAPCVGFNQQNFRLGYGGGFYDRTLAKYRNAHSIGVAYEISRAQFAADTYDIALHTIVTEAARYSAT